MERVGIYNRCSTEEEAQINALAVQAEESLEIVKKHKDWVLVRQYIESQSGTTAEKRAEYQKMLEDMENGEITLVMIKSIDRLNRNTRDWYLFLDCITRNNIKLYFYLDNKYYTPEDSLITGIKAILAEEFSRELSKKIKNAHKRRQQKKSGINITRAMFGWDKIGKDEFVLNEEESTYYRMALDFAENGMGYRSIAKIMAELGVRGKNGERIEQIQWRKMIRSPRVHGTVVLNTREYNFEAKRHEKLPEEQWIYVDDALPAIISREHHERILAVLDERAENYNHLTERVTYHGKHELSGKIFCGSCGSVYYRASYKKKSGGTKVQWKCKEHVSYGGKSDKGNGCSNINLCEDELYEAIDSACKIQMKNTVVESEELINETLRVIRAMFSSDKTDIEIKKLENQKKKLISNKDKLMSKLMDGIISDKDFKIYNEKYSSELEDTEKKLENLYIQRIDMEKQEERLLVIKEELLKGKIIEEATIKEFRSNIDKIIVNENGKIDIEFNMNKIVGANVFSEKQGVHIKVNYNSIADKKRVEIHNEADEIYQLIKENKYIKREEITEKLGISKYILDTRLKVLRDSGKLRFVKQGVGHWEILED